MAFRTTFAAIGAAMLMGGPALAVQADETISPAAEALAGDLAEAAVALGPDAALAVVRAALISTLVDAGQDAQTERAALTYLIDTSADATLRAAAISVLAQLPDTPEGYADVNDFIVGGLEGGGIPVPEGVPQSQGGGSDY